LERLTGKEERERIANEKQDEKEDDKDEVTVESGVSSPPSMQ
jgi:hypothetical protein